MNEDLEKKLKLATARAARLKSARDQSEILLELKSKELYDANCELERAHKDLEIDIQHATYKLSISNERLLKALKERSSFIGQMSHEVRTPLNAIAGLSEILLTTDLDATQLDYIDTINSAARSLTVMISDMLDLTTIEAGKVKLRPELVNARRIHHNVVSMFRAEAEAKGLQLHLEASLPEDLFLDKGRYKQILSNLISNAIKNTEQGDIFVTVVFSKGIGLNDRDKLTLNVKDTGVGIEQSQLKRIFSAYEQLGEASVGVGLGLAISRQLAELMQGKLSCQSEVGVGSVFKLSIPVDSFDQQGDTQIEKEKDAVVRQQKLKILVAEDNPTNQKVIVAQLAQLGQEADITANGAEAISKLRDQSYDLVLLDILMPIMDGEETLKIIRSSSSRIASHYCVALTASSYEDQHDRLISLGFDEFLSKPLSMAELSNMLSFVSRKVNETEEASLPPPILEFDLSDLKVHFGDAAETIFVEIAPTFLEHSERDLNLLKAAVDQDQTEKIQKLSHSIKGAALSLGLKKLAVCLDSIEQKPGAPTVHESLASAQELWSAAANSIEALLSRLKRDSTSV